MTEQPAADGPVSERPVTQRVVEVGLGERSYPVVIGAGLLRTAGARIRERFGRRRLGVVADAAVAALHGDALRADLDAAGLSHGWVEVPSGESSKSWAGLAAACDGLLDLNLDRGDLVLALGGGVVGDLAGLAAALYKRGVDYVQLPTSLLAQVDSSVGGKTAIDTRHGKNLVGAFHQPRLVLADLDVLATLPDREMRCGYAEVLKYGLLGDAAFVDWLELHGGAVLAREPEALGRAVEHCVAMKARIVAADEREGGVRALLNLGHTFGHALEAQAIAATGRDDVLKHGEAVAVGCALAFRFSASLGLCRPQDAARAALAVTGAGLPARLADTPGGPFPAPALLEAMAQDKKAEGGALTFVLARGVGQAFVAKDVEPSALLRFLQAEGAV